MPKENRQNSPSQRLNSSKLNKIALSPKKATSSISSAKQLEPKKQSQRISTAEIKTIPKKAQKTQESTDKSYKLKRAVNKKSIFKTDIQKLEALINPPTENEVLTSKVLKLSKIVQKQKRALNELYDRLIKERQEVKEVTEKFFEAKKNDTLVLELQKKLRFLQSNELNLVSELKEQQRRSEKLTKKLDELHIQSEEKVESIEQTYKDYYSKQHDIEIQKYKQQIEILKTQTDQLLATKQILEHARNIEDTSKCATESEVIALKSQLEGKVRENNILSEEIERLKQLKTKSEINQAEKEKRVEELAIENQNTQNENIQLRNLAEERIKLEESEKGRNENLEKKLEVLVSRMQDLQIEVESKDDDYSKMEIFYKEKLEMTKRSQDQRKKEWTEIYYELLEEVKQLKSGMDVLSNGNQNLMSSISSQGFKEIF